VTTGRPRPFSWTSRWTWSPSSREDPRCDRSVRDWVKTAAAGWPIVTLANIERPVSGGRSEWQRSLPKLERAALHGPAADWAEAAAGVYSEASLVGTLGAALVGFGCAIGRSESVAAGFTRHYSNENLLLVGPSGTGRKGVAMDLGLLPVMAADEGFARDRIMRGFGSGEALVEAVQDDVEETAEGGESVLPAAGDKRLLIYEAEFANVITVAERRDSSLSGNLRAAWDGFPLANRTKGQPIVARDAHVSVVAGITQTELCRRMSNDSVSNGFANRFLHVAVYRSAMLPSPPVPSRTLRARHVTRFAQALAHRRKLGRRSLTRSQDADARWGDAYREELSVDRYGLAGEVSARAEAHALRLSLLYALLDMADRIELVHVEAALAFWRYCEASARLIYGRRLGIPDADKLLDELWHAGRNGMSREDIGDRVFSKHGGTARTEAATQPLLAARLIVERRISTGGRPATRYVHIDHCGEAG
jgi:hypothetical protein